MINTMVKDLQLGQTIRFEFGAPNNCVTLHIERIESFEKMVMLIGKNNGFQRDYSFRPEDMVEVVKDA